MSSKNSNKLMSLEEAIKKFVNDGDTVFLGGYYCRTVMSAICEIARQKKRNLTIIHPNTAHEVEWLIAAGCVKRLIFTVFAAWTGTAKCFRRAVEHGIPNKIEIEEYTNLSLPMMLMAGAYGIPFIPVKDMRGSDLLKYRGFMGENKAKTIINPFTSEEVLVVPSLNPDVAIVHVQQADPEGNAQIWGIADNCEFGAKASKRVIVTAERIVDREMISRDPDRTKIPGYRVNAVVESPWGAHPYAVPGFYDIDLEFHAYWSQMSQTVETTEKFLEEWVYTPKDRYEYIDYYIKKFGYEKLKRLTGTNPYYSFSVNYGW